VIGAIALWVVGRALIRFGVRLLVRSLKYPFDQTVAGYIGTATLVLLNIALIVAILGFFGVETTTFAALMAGVGVAIGAAWSGLLAHLAASVFLLILRPFKVGDFISAGGVQGTVEEIGLFITRLNTHDNIQTYVSNSRVFGDTIQNFSANAYRRVDLVAQIHNAVDHATAIRVLRTAWPRSPTSQRLPGLMSRSYSSIRSGLCWPCARTAATSTTGRSISTPIAPSVRRSARRAFRPPSRQSSCAPTAAGQPRPEAELASSRPDAMLCRSTRRLNGR
jgi:Mechanosensitive ion channel